MEFTDSRDIEHEPNPKRVIRDDDGDYVLQGYYIIAKGRINTAAKPVSWIHHLSEKRWFTTDDAHDLIDLVRGDYPKVIVFGV
jgi:hypothetical protein